MGRGMRGPRAMSRRMSQARVGANRRAREGMTTFFSLLAKKRAELSLLGLQHYWFDLCDRLDVRDAQSAKVWDLLGIQYDSQKNRSYHNLDHIADCIALLEVQSAFMLDDEDKSFLALALFFHDAVYDTWATDNEARSALFAEVCMKMMNVFHPHRIVQVEELIMATKHDMVGRDLLGQLIADIDLYGLSLPMDRFRAQTERVWAEYYWVGSIGEFRDRQRDFFKRTFADRPIYQTPWFYKHFEKSAQANIKSLIDVVHP